MLGAAERLHDNYLADYPYQPKPAVILESEPTQSIKSLSPAHTQPFPWLAVVLAGYFAVSDVAVMPLTEIFKQSDWGAVWVYISFGAILAQVALLSTWLVFGPVRYWKRLLFFWLGVAVVGILWS